jgi:RNA polymerase sigma-70 factor, ECF subfamily
VVDTGVVEDVIARAQQGDAHALGVLWREYNHLLLRYFRAKAMPDVEDLSSTVWVEVATSLHRFAGSEHDFRRWLFTIAARRRIDDIRSDTRRRRQADLHPPGQDLVAPSASDDVDRTLALDRAIDLVASLPPDQREAVTLRIIADLSVSEVAAIMGKREGTVRVLVHRGLRQLSTRADVTQHPARTMSSS